MKKHFTFTIKNKLIIGLSLCALIMVAIGCMGVYGQNQIDGDITDMYQGDLQPILYVGHIRDGLHQNVTELDQLVLGRDVKAVAAVKAFVAQNNADIDKTWNIYYPMIASDRERKAADAVAGYRKQLDALTATVLSDAAQGKFDTDVLVNEGSYEKLFTQAMKSVEVLYAENKDQAQQSYDDAQHAFRRIWLTMVGVIAFGFVLLL